MVRGQSGAAVVVQLSLCKHHPAQFGCNLVVPFLPLHQKSFERALFRRGRHVQSVFLLSQLPADLLEQPRLCLLLLRRRLGHGRHARQHRGLSHQGGAEQRCPHLAGVLRAAPIQQPHESLRHLRSDGSAAVGKQLGSTQQLRLRQLQLLAQLMQKHPVLHLCPRIVLVLNKF